MTDLMEMASAGTGKSNYDDLKFYFRNLNTLFSIRKTLSMDMMTAMPTGGMSRRLYDITSITRRIYAETTTPAVTKLLDKVEDEFEKDPDSWSQWDKANLVEMRRIHNHLSALPPNIYTACARFTNEGRKRHAIAVEKKSWKEAEVYIQQVVDTYRQVAELKQEKFQTQSLYNALLLGYCSDISVDQMDKLYGNLINPLKDIRERALEKQESLDDPIPLSGNFSKNEQMWLNQSILDLMGFDFSHGSLYITHISPSTGGTPEDVRVLVRCSERDSFLDSLEDTLYQGARALYIQNLPSAWKMQPVGQDQGTLMMNAMSIFYETIIGRTPQFFSFVSARAEGVFRSLKNQSFEPENLYRLKKVIRTTPRRDEADELSKIFHDILRYRIERDLIDGRLQVKDLPERWNEESKKLLGAKPKSDADSALQNPDWFTGRFGFIATNTLSHIIAAELHNKLFEEQKDLPGSIQKGDLTPINEWLKENVHSKGCSESALAMVKNITGRELSEESLLEHFERRYLSDKR